jgi:hypothetical protein
MDAGATRFRRRNTPLISGGERGKMESADRIRDSGHRAGAVRLGFGVSRSLFGALGQVWI